jgi:hypothetical protein
MLKGTLEDWLVYQGRIRGYLNQQAIVTSRVVSRDGRLIETRSGSIYRLGECNVSKLHDDWISLLDVWISCQEGE